MTISFEKNDKKNVYKLNNISNTIKLLNYSNNNIKSINIILFYCMI